MRVLSDVEALRSVDARWLDRRPGIAMAAMIAMIAITIISSISVKPFLPFRILTLQNLFIHPVIKVLSDSIQARFTASRKRPPPFAPLVPAPGEQSPCQMYFSRIPNALATNGLQCIINS